MQALNENGAAPRSALMGFLVPSWEYKRPRISAHVHFAIGASALLFGASAAYHRGRFAGRARDFLHRSTTRTST
jgi:hypothetical protein